MVNIKMPANMMIGPPTLRIKDLQRQMSFYEKELNLQVNHRYRADDDLETIELGFKGKFKDCREPLLILKHDPNAKETTHNFAGLYHFAILVPDRKSLASAYSSIDNSKTRFDGFADHLVSESLYLHDPERNGIEIYRDKPRNEWKYDTKGHIVMDTIPLDLKSLLAELGTYEGKNITFPNGAKIGHMHLRVTNLERSLRFYQKLGFDVTADMSAMGACFLSAGGYHHHIGMNIWHSLDGKMHVKDESGLDFLMIRIPDCSFIEILAQEFEDRILQRDSNAILVSDPDGIHVLIKFH
ncbi:MAG: VOC family protein [Nitrosopumilaceae archaeon]